MTEANSETKLPAVAKARHYMEVTADHVLPGDILMSQCREVIPGGHSIPGYQLGRVIGITKTTVIGKRIVVIMALNPWDERERFVRYDWECVAVRRWV